MLRRRATTWPGSPGRRRLAPYRRRRAHAHERGRARAYRANPNVPQLLVADRDRWRAALAQGDPDGRGHDQTRLHRCSGGRWRIQLRSAQAGEQVILRNRCPSSVGNPDEALAAERGNRDLWRQLAEPRVLNLARVREQGLPLAVQHAADIDVARDPAFSRFCLSALLVGELTLIGHVGAEFAERFPDLPPVAAAHSCLVILRRDA